MRFRILVLTCVAAAAPAHAEFVLLSTPPAEDGASVTPPSAASTRPKTKSPIRRKPAPEPAAMGFGDQIPLSFAVRQIVPARFQVAFGKEVDREESVNWKGGKPWRSVLSEAIKPVGLRIDVRRFTVMILEADSTR
jgi:hypothetical protein